MPAIRSGAIVVALLLFGAAAVAQRDDRLDTQKEEVVRDIDARSVITQQKVD